MCNWRRKVHILKRQQTNKNRGNNYFMCYVIRPAWTFCPNTKYQELKCCLDSTINLCKVCWHSDAPTFCSFNSSSRVKNCLWLQLRGHRMFATPAPGSKHSSSGVKTILKKCLRLQLWGHKMFATSAPGSQNVCDSSLGVHKMFATPAPGSQNVCDSSSAVTKCLQLQLRGQKLMAGSSSSSGTSQVLKVWDNG